MPVRRHGQWGEDEPTLCDRRVGQHADDVRLAQRGEVPERHRRRRQRPQHRLPRLLRPEEAEVDEAQDGDEPAGLRRHR